MLHLNSENFDNAVKDGKTVVDFYTDWCGPCKAMAPVFEKLSREIEGIKFAKLNAEEAEDISAKFGIMSVPTTIFFENGKEKDRVTGFGGESALRKWIEKQK